MWGRGILCVGRIRGGDSEFLQVGNFGVDGGERAQSTLENTERHLFRSPDLLKWSPPL